MKLATAAFPSLLLGTAVASSALSVSSSEITPASPHTIVAGSRSSTIVHAVPRALDSAHRFALRHSRSVAQDLRAALGGLIFSHQPNSLRRQLSPRQQNGVYDGGSGSAAQKVLYCKAVPPKFGSTHGGVNEGGSGINGGPSPTGQGGGNSTNPTTGSGHTGIGSGQPPAPTQNVPITSPWKLVEAHVSKRFLGLSQVFSLPCEKSGMATSVERFADFYFIFLTMISVRCIWTSHCVSSGMISHHNNRLIRLNAA